MTPALHLLSSRNSHLAVALVCLILGVLAVMQFRTQGGLRDVEQPLTAPDSAQVISSLVETNSELWQEVEALENRLAEYEGQAGTSDLNILTAELNRMKLVNGLIEASGPGIRITISGRMTTQDMQDLINELRNAGAEAIAVNDRRIVAQTVVGRRDDDLTIDGVTVKGPYTIRAIGPAETLERAIERKGGLVPLLRYNNPHLTITVAPEQELTVPVYDDERKFADAQPVPAASPGKK